MHGKKVHICIIFNMPHFMEHILIGEYKGLCLINKHEKLRKDRYCITHIAVNHENIIHE